MSCCSDIVPICPCGEFIHPAIITNVPGLDQITYRVGDYTTFRHALLRSLPGENSLTTTVNNVVRQNWRPGAKGDLALQMMEWWAYLADILTFYNERGANEFFLRTADQPETVNRLVYLLGFRPRPGIGATGAVAALLNGSAPVTLPQGFQIQSNPGPGQPAQIFELDERTTVSPPDAIPVDPPPVSGLTLVLDTASSTPTVTSVALVLGNTISGLKVGDQLLVLKKGWTGTDADYALGSLASLTPGKDPRGNAFTKIFLTQIAAGSDFAGAAILGSATGYRLLKSKQTSLLYQYAARSDWKSVSGAGASAFADLASIVRQINAGDPVLFTDPNWLSRSQLVSVASVSELIYYANYDQNNHDPTKAPASSSSQAVAAIPIPHTQISFAPSLSETAAPATTQVIYAWNEVGQLIDPAALGPSFTASASAAFAASQPSAAAAALQISSQLAVSPPSGTAMPANDAAENIFLEDSAGNGVEAEYPPVSAGQTQVTLTVPPPGFPAQSLPALISPLRLLFNLLPVSRGKKVTGEVLGTGNAAVAGQDFTLQKTPVTYFQATGAAAVSGDSFSSTVQVWVNGMEWSEVPTLYNQPANAQVFITKEDEQGQTHVIFGDGQNGQRPPTGAGIVATYRYGSGADSPTAGTLTNILQPLPGLKSIRNPVAAGGGADPDAPDKVRQLAPLTVLTFGRAISIDDYEAIAAHAPGVTRAKAEFAFDPTAQRPRVTIWVGDNGAAAAAAQTALAGAADPNRITAVILATKISVTLNAALVIDPKYDPTAVIDAAQSALVDADTGLGLFGVNRLGINEAVYDSQIYAACMVPGVLAVKELNFEHLAGPATGGRSLAWAIRQHVPARNFHRPVVQPQCTDHRHDPGSGGYFFLDPANLTLTQA